MSYSPTKRKKLKLKNLNPFNFKTINTVSKINWMRHLIPQEEVNQSLTNLLVEKEKELPFVLHLFEDKKLIMKFASSIPKNNQCISLKKQLKPELLFHKSVLDKIYKLRDIFVYFDQDRSRTLDITELCAMFNSNNIPITKDELIYLFTHPGEKKRKSWQYKITFLDFVEFCLDEQCQEKYRALVTKIKQRTKNRFYIPLTLEQTLEYISNQTKIQACYKRIHNGIKKIEHDKKSKKHLSTRTFKNDLLYKFGIGRGVNSGKVCKAFHDIIDMNNNKLNQIEKEIQKYSFQETKDNNNNNNSIETRDKESTICQTSDSLLRIKLSNQTFCKKRRVIQNSLRIPTFKSSLPSLSLTSRRVEDNIKTFWLGRNEKQHSMIGNYNEYNKGHVTNKTGSFFNYIRNAPNNYKSYNVIKNSLIRKYKKNLEN